tara:strand:- start:187 stop:402 length:216 start_codon:yes stop_codon:yes gene_type:complete
MALVKSVLKNKIKSALLSEQGNDATQAQKDAADRLATKLSNAIDSYIKSATVLSTGVNSGGPVTSTSTSIS